jgi:DNA-binding beta-propeller fold protein YncE
MSGRKVLQDAVVSSQVRCPYHERQSISLFCYSCEQLICRDCTLVGHLGHNFEFLPQCAPKTRKEIGTLTVPLLNIQADITVALKRLEQIEAKIGVQEAKASGEIRAAFEKMRLDLERREIALMNKLSEMVADKRSAISKQSDLLEEADGEIQDALDEVQSALQEASDGDLMSTRAQLEQKVKREEQAHRNLPLSPCVTADIASNFPALSPLENISEFGDVFHATIDEPPISSLQQKTMVTLRLHNAQNLKLLHVDAAFTSLANPEVATPVQILPKSAGVYQLHYIPAVRGRHDLVVKVNSINIPGSPFRVFVKIHPTQLGDPILTSDFMGRPFGITVTPNGEILVAQNGGSPKQLTFLDKKCRKLRSIVTDRFYFPRGVAINSEGAVFSTDKGIEYTLMKFEKMKLVKAVNKGSKNVELLKLINGYLYACDMALSKVHIFTQDLDHLSSFETREVPNPHDLAAGEDGLYVVGGCDKGAKIGVYTYEGNFVRHVVPYKVTQGDPTVRLSEMRGICFDCYGHMFVTQVGAGVGGIYVFKTSGEYVTSFGVSRAVLDHPVGIAIDEDGFVYVSDHKTVKKVHIF